MNWFKKLLCKIFGIGCPPAPSPDPTPGPSRPGLLFGYYGMQPGDAAQIADHVNVAHFGAWGDWTVPGRSWLIDSIVALGHEAVTAGIHRLIFTLDFCVFTQTEPRQLLPQSTAIQYLTDFRDRLQSEGLLQHVIGWYPIDEPNGHGIELSAQQITDANQTIRYALQDSLPLYCVYTANNGAYPAIGTYNVAGFDNYGAPIFTDGEYDNLRNQLSSSQTSIILPGGGDPWRESPWPFYNHAQTDMKVSLLMPFKWFGTDGIGVNGMAPVYRQVGQLIKAANP